MSTPSRPSFWEELRARRVVRMVVAYAVAAFVVLQIAEITFGPLGIPRWVMRLLIVLAVAGFPVAAIAAWALERSPEGVRMTRGSAAGDDADGRRRFALFAAGVGLITLVAAASAWAWLSGGGPTESADPAAREEVTAGAEGGVEGVAGAPGDEREVRASVAVLPCDDLSPDRDQGHMSDGITEDIVSRLGRSEGLRIPSRTTVMRYKDTELSVPEIGQELVVSHILECSVQRSGDQIRVTAQLIDASEDDHVWADAWTRRLEDVFAVQSEIAGRVARALEVRLGPGAASAGGTSPEAYEAYLRAEEWRRRRYRSVPDMENALAEALSRHRRAIEIDSTFAPAWAGAAEISLAILGADTAAAVARRALALDPRSDRAHATLGLALHQQDRGEAAIQQLRLATAINPNSGEAWFGLGNVHLQEGRLLEAWRALRRGAEVGPPASPISFALPDLLARLELWEEAAAYLRWIEEIRGQPSELHCRLAENAALAGEAAAARTHLKRMLAESPEADPGELQLLCLGQVRLLLGDLEGATEVLQGSWFRSWHLIVEAASAGVTDPEAIRQREDEYAGEWTRTPEREGRLPPPPQWRASARIYLAAVRGDPEATAERLETYLQRFGPESKFRAYLSTLAPEVAREPSVARVLNEMEHRLADVREVVERDLEASPPPPPVQRHLQAARDR